ncbi:hypothetical protein HMPREF9225_0042 [Peptoniphilus duerdenii ATCC BAA-1640]|uniref:Uncharacterized protein n=1 Tax=Peptoniphilus duerdenii ATCC BAA-1640 TaxID=862517 RepID=E0NIQ3_9FIRM|nr:hypothetical protein HMPREF9225_0042 [Peptoniphilus duerdenii ATCC BAA-1640]
MEAGCFRYIVVARTRSVEVIPVRLTAFAQGDCSWDVGLVQSVPKKTSIAKSDL